MAGRERSPRVFVFDGSISNASAHKDAATAGLRKQQVSKCHLPTLSLAKYARMERLSCTFPTHMPSLIWQAARFWRMKTRIILLLRNSSAVPDIFDRITWASPYFSMASP